MAVPARARATYQDVLDAPADTVAEVVDGVLHTHPRPELRHARGSTKLGGWMDRHFDDDDDGPGGWILLDEPELHLLADIVVPDLAGWRRTRMPELPHEPFATLAPDWVCEGLSPSTAALDRGPKMDVYAREGVSHLWLFDPVLQTLEAYRLEAQRWLRLGTWSGDARARIEPFDAVELPLGKLWAR